MSLLEFEGVKKWYGMANLLVWALRDIHLRIDPGEFVAVWGPSGSGKSTLCNLAGLIDEPNAGRLTFRGRDVVECDDNTRSTLRSHNIGFVFQNFNLIPVFSALENVLLPQQLRGRLTPPTRQRAQALLETVGLADLGSRRPSELSGGQQQRVAIARALITEPVLIIADEPTANLDSRNATAIIDLMRETNRREGTTFLFSTHDERLLERVQRRVHLRDGVVIDDETITPRP